MMSHPEACTILTRMEVRLHETRHNLYELERSLRDRAERKRSTRTRKCVGTTAACATGPARTNKPICASWIG